VLVDSPCGGHGGHDDESTPALRAEALGAGPDGDEITVAVDHLAAQRGIALLSADDAVGARVQHRIGHELIDQQGGLVPQVVQLEAFADAADPPAGAGRSVQTDSQLHPLGHLASQPPARQTDS